MLAIITPVRAGVKAKDCYDWQHKFHEHNSGVYSVYVGPNKKRIRVYCDMDTDGGGWTVCSEMFSINRSINSLVFTCVILCFCPKF